MIKAYAKTDVGKVREKNNAFPCLQTGKGASH